MRPIYCFMSLLVVFLLTSCGGAPLNHFSNISHFDVKVREFGLGEFLSMEREILSITVDSANNARYECLQALVNEGGNVKHIAFYRTNRLPGESAFDAQKRLQEIQVITVKKAKLPAIKDQFWYNKKSDKVSMLVFKKDS